MVNPRKVYPIDSGLVKLYDPLGETNVGHALETCFLLELERRGAEIWYVRNSTGTEVDFLARYPEDRRELIQVCTHLDTEEVQERELRGL